MLINNVLPTAMTYVTGAPLGSYETVGISAETGKLPRYQSLIDDGLMVVAGAEESSGQSQRKSPQTSVRRRDQGDQLIAARRRFRRGSRCGHGLRRV